MSKGLLAGGDLGNIGAKLMREQQELIAQKWEAVGLLEGLSGYQKGNMAQLFENQAAWMINESTTTDSSGAFETVVFPVIKRIFSKLLANEIVSVQALDRPIGRIYFYNPKVSKRVNNSHTSLDGGYSNAAANYSLDADGKRVAKTGGTTFETYSLYDAYYAETATDYGNALFDRTTGKITVKAPILSGATFTNGVTKFYTANVTGFTSNGGKLQGPVGDPLDTEEFLAGLKITSNVAFVGNAGSNGVYDIAAGAAIPFNLPVQSYGKSIVDPTTGALKVILDLTYPGATDGSYIALSGATTGTPVFTATYSVYSDLEQDSEMAEVSFDMNYTTIDVGPSRKLRATFTPEIAADSQAFHGLSIEGELVSLMSQVVSAEIDRSILREIRNAAAFVDRFDYNGFAKRSGITRQDYNQELIIKINQISGAISKSTLHGGANWIVCSTEVAAIFNSLEYFHVSDASPEETKFSMGIEKVGSLQNRYSVYVDPMAPANTILIGHKGDNIFSTGYVYAPYTPIMLLPKMTNFNDGTSVHMLHSRYATKVINNRFYGKILVDAIPTYAVGSDLRA